MAKLDYMNKYCNTYQRVVENIRDMDIHSTTTGWIKPPKNKKYRMAIIGTEKRLDGLYYAVGKEGALVWKKRKSKEPVDNFAVADKYPCLVVYYFE